MLSVRRKKLNNSVLLFENNDCVIIRTVSFTSICLSNLLLQIAKIHHSVLCNF